MSEPNRPAASRPSGVLSAVTDLPWRSVLPPKYGVLLFWGAPLLILLVAVAHSLYSERPISMYMRDPAAVTNVPLVTGMVSNVGCLGWSAAATISLVTALLLFQDGRRGDAFWFFTCFGLITGVLLADDMFMVHERIFPDFQKPLFASYGLFLLFVLIRFRSVYMHQNLFFLVAALGALSLGLLADLLPVGVIPGHHLYEDGFKLIGISNWLGFTVQASRGYIAARIA